MESPRERGPVVHHFTLSKLKFFSVETLQLDWLSRRANSYLAAGGDRKSDLIEVQKVRIEAKKLQWKLYAASLLVSFIGFISSQVALDSIKLSSYGLEIPISSLRESSIFLFGLLSFAGAVVSFRELALDRIYSFLIELEDKEDISSLIFRAKFGWYIDLFSIPAAEPSGPRYRVLAKAQAFLPFFLLILFCLCLVFVAVLPYLLCFVVAISVFFSPSMGALSYAILIFFGLVSTSSLFIGLIRHYPILYRDYEGLYNLMTYRSTNPDQHDILMKALWRKNWKGRLKLWWERARERLERPLR